MTRKVVSPIALDKSINTTEQTPRNIADVLAQQLAAIKTAIESGNGNLEAAFVCYYGVTTATQIKDAIEDGKVPYFYYNGAVAQLWKVETDKYTFRTTNTRSVEGHTILDVVDYVVNGSVWSTITREVSGGSSSGQSYIASVSSLADFDTTGKSGMQDLISVANVPADGVYQVSVMLHITPKTASATKSDLVLQFTSSDNTGWPSHTFHAVVDDSQTFAQQLSFSTSVSLNAGQNTLRIQCGGLNTEYLVFVDELTLAQLVNGVYHNGDDFDEVHTLPEAADFNNDDGVLVDGATGGPRFMLWRTLANKVLGFIKSLSTTITAFRQGDMIPVDGPSGTAKMSKDDLLRETAENVPTDEIKNSIERNEREIYRVIENFTDNLNSGYINVQNGVVSIGASVNYGYAVYDVDEVAIVSTVAGLEGSSSVAAVAFFSDNTISTESFLGCEFGDEYVQEYIGAFNHAIFPPTGTKKVVVTIRLANNDSTRGVYKYDKPARLEIVNKMNFSAFDKLTKGSCNWKNSAITLGTSANWAYCEIDNLSDLYAVKTAAGMEGADAPAVLFFSSTEKRTDTFISCLYANEVISDTIGYLDTEIAIPSNAVSAIVNIRVSEMDGSLGFYSTGKKEDIVRRTLVSDGTGRYRIDGGVISYETHDRWSFAAVKADKIRKVRILAGSNGSAIPAIMFFSDKDFTTDTYLGCLYGDVDSSGGAYYAGPIIVPDGAVWAVLNYYNAQADYYVDLINGGTKNEIIVAHDGSGNFETIKEAVDVSDKDVVIKIMPGVYEEEIDCFEREVNIIGLDKQSCIWVCKKGTYNNPPLEASVGHIENITLYSRYESGESAEIGTATGAYACHVESSRSSATFAHGKSLTFKNCILRSDFAPAIGMGALNGWSFRLEDCELINGQVVGRGSYLDEGSIGAMYIHDQNYTEIKEKANITIKNCIFRNLNYNNAVALKNNGLVDGRGIDFAFVGNILCSPAGKTSGNLWWRTADHFENGWYNSPISFGNSNSALDS